jgi:hypothetical protein
MHLSLPITRRGASGDGPDPPVDCTQDIQAYHHQSSQLPYLKPTERFTAGYGHDDPLRGCGCLRRPQIVRHGGAYGNPGTYCAHSARVMGSPTTAHTYVAAAAGVALHSRVVPS